MIKRIVCLANSRKAGDRCIAGRELLEGDYVGPWVRPVSGRPDEAVSLPEIQCSDGEYPCLLDVVDIPIVGPRGKPNQPENWLIDQHSSWRKVGRCRYEDLNLLTDPVAPLWINGRSTSHNLNDYVLQEEANDAAASLRFIAVNDLQLKVFTTGAGFSNPKRRVQAVFSFNGEQYRLWATDSTIEDEYRSLADGTYNLGPCYLTISLAEPFHDCCYKVVAGIMTGDT